MAVNGDVVNGDVVNGDVVNGAASNGDDHWTVPASQEARNCHNPIRAIEESQFEDVLRVARERQDIEFIKLSIGTRSIWCRWLCANESVTLQHTAVLSGETTRAIVCIGEFVGT